MIGVVWMFIIFIGIGIAIGAWIAYDDGYDYIPNMFVGLLLGVAVSLLMMLGMFLISIGAEWEIIEEPVEQYEICSLQDNYGVEGYIGRWHHSIDSELEYAFMYEVKGKGLTVGHIPAEDTYIVFDEDATSVVIYVYTEQYKSGFWRWFWGVNSRPAEYRIVAPEGTIVITDESIIDLK